MKYEVLMEEVMDPSNAYKSVLFLLPLAVVVCSGKAGWGYEPRVCMTLLLVDTVTLELETKVHTKVRNHKEDPIWNLLLVKSAYYHFHT